MATLPTLPRRSRLERISLGLGFVLALFGAIAVAGWLLHLGTMVQLAPGSSPITPNIALCVLILGAVLLLIESGWAKAT